MKKVWAEVDRYFCDRVAPSAAGDELDAAVAANKKAGLPAIDVTRLQGKFLDFLVRVSGARSVLEIGTLGGYSTIWLARALPANGRLISLEMDAKHAEVARTNIAFAGLGGMVEVRLGKALDTLPQIAAESRGPFDLIFIDADKTNIPAYFDWALKLSRPEIGRAHV